MSTTEQEKENQQPYTLLKSCNRPLPNLITIPLVSPAITLAEELTSFCRLSNLVCFQTHQNRRKTAGLEGKRVMKKLYKAKRHTWALFQDQVQKTYRCGLCEANLIITEWRQKEKQNVAHK